MFGIGRRRRCWPWFYTPVPAPPGSASTPDFVPPGFSPPTANQQLYLDARDLYGDDNGDINSWVDRSSNHWDVTPNNAGFAGKPKLRKGSGSQAPTHEKTVEFIAGSSSSATTGPAFQRLAVTQPSFAAGLTLYMWGVWGKNTAVPIVGFLLDNFEFSIQGDTDYPPAIGPPIGALTGWNGPNNKLPAAQTAIGTGVLTVTCSPPSNGTGLAALRFNGVQQTVSFGGTWAAPTAAGNSVTLRISDRNEINSDPIIGQVGAVLLYSAAHDVSTVGQIEAYLRGIWG